jgi:hypothetical protein
VITNKGPKSRSARVDKSGVRTAVDVYDVVADGGETPYEVGSDASIPRIGATYPDDPFSFCVDVSVDLVAGTKTGYEVTCSYSSEREVQENPLNEPASIEWDTEQFQMPVFQDEDGDACVNSAGSYYDPPIMKDDSRWFAEVSVNVAEVPSWFLTYPDAVNSDEIVVDGLTVGIGVAKIQRVGLGKWLFRNGVKYRTVRYHLHFKEDGWHAKPLDQGFHRIDPADANNRIPIKLIDADTSEQTFPVDPVLLDGSGDVLSNPGPATAVFGDHRIYKRKAFASLPGIG